MPSREPTPEDFPDCDEFEITAGQNMGEGLDAVIKVNCAKADLMKTRAAIKEQGYRIWFMVGKKAKPA